MKNKQMSQTPEAIKQRNWRWKMSPKQRAAFLEKRRKRFAEVGIEEQRQYRKNNPGLTARQAKDWYHRNAERARSIQKNYRDRIKTEILTKYGGVCACCGESEPLFLTIDHIIPIKKKRVRSGGPFYVQLKNLGYPKGFQVLCFNCNMAKRSKPACPHKTRSLKLVATAEEPVVGLQRRRT